MSVSELKELGLRFESLGGGAKNRGDWPFGCEFGFFQRSLGIEPLGFLSWASIHVEDLIRGIETEFEGVEDAENLEIEFFPPNTRRVIDKKYMIRMDHVHLYADNLPAAEALNIIWTRQKYLAKKFISSIKSGDKIFVYKTHEYVLQDNEIKRIGGALEKHGPAKLLYVTGEDENNRAFTVKELSPSVLIGYIDRFAPQPGGIKHNDIGWQNVCRSVVAFLDAGR